MLPLCAALYVSERGHYIGHPQVIPFTRGDRAEYYRGPLPVIAHPPCQQWGRLRKFAHNDPAERALALRAYIQVIRYGGILEHPRDSVLWSIVGAPPPDGDLFARPCIRTVDVSPASWGFPCPKPTRLLIAGYHLDLLPPIPNASRQVHRSIESMSQWQRSITPPGMVDWLISVASRCHPR